MKIIKKLSFNKVRATKEFGEDVECSNCRNGYDDTVYWYIVEQQNWGGLQLCEKCFNKLE